MSKSDLRKFKDLDDEYCETGSSKAAKKRLEAMGELSPENYKRASERLVGRTVDKRDHNMEKLRKLGFSGWTRKD